MGRLLEKAISEASKLPESEQEAIGAWLLVEIESERRWSALFAKPAPTLERMANQALEEHEQGGTTPLDPAPSLDRLGWVVWAGFEISHHGRLSEVAR